MTRILRFYVRTVAAHLMIEIDNVSDAGQDMTEDDDDSETALHMSDH